MRPPLSTTTAPPETGALDPLDELIAEIARLQRTVLAELRERRAHLSRELSSLDVEIAELTGEAEVKETTRAGEPASLVREREALAELIAELEAAPNRTLNIRKAHLELKSIKALVKAHPHLLRLGGKGAWPTVSLLERAKPESSGTETEGSRQEFFAFRDPSSDPQSANESR